MLTTREYHSIADARDALNGRLDRAAMPCLFGRADWFDLLHTHVFVDMPVHVIAAEDGNAQVWLFLMSPTPRQLSALANWYSFSWQPLFTGNPDAGQRARLMDAVSRVLLEKHGQIHLYPVDGQEELMASLRRAGWLAIARPMGGRYVLRPDGRDFATWWAQRPGPLRTLVQRRSRKNGYSLSISTTLTEDLWRDYVDVQGRSWKAPEPGLNFLRALAQQESDAGTLRLGFARLDGRPIATQLWTIENGVALIHKLSHDRAHDAGSPGTLLSHTMFAHAIDGERVRLIDYGTGDNPYKRDWMDERLPLHRIDAFNPRFASSWLPAARTAISALVG